MPFSVRVPLEFQRKPPDPDRTPLIVTLELPVIVKRPPRVWLPLPKDEESIDSVPKLSANNFDWKNKITKKNAIIVFLILKDII